jgi:hypothetical protein
LYKRVASLRSRGGRRVAGTGIEFGREGKHVTQAPSSGRSCPIGLRIGLKDLTPLSSVAYGATFFQRKKAPAHRHAALVTQKEIP